MQITKEILRALWEQRMLWEQIEPLCNAAGAGASEIAEFKNMYSNFEAFPPKDKEKNGGCEDGDGEKFKKPKKGGEMMKDEEEEGEEKKKTTKGVGMESFEALLFANPALKALIDKTEKEGRREKTASEVRNLLNQRVVGTHNLTDITTYPPCELKTLTEAILSTNPESLAHAMPAIEIGLQNIMKSKGTQIVQNQSKAYVPATAEAPQGYREFFDRMDESSASWAKANRPDIWQRINDANTETKKMRQTQFEYLIKGQKMHGNKVFDGNEASLVEAWDYLSKQKMPISKPGHVATEELLMSTTEIPYRPLITTLIQRQMWWQMIALGFCGTPSGTYVDIGGLRGSLGRVCQVTTEYLAEVEAGNENYELRVRDLAREVKFAHSWQTYFARRQGIACRISKEQMFFLSRAPLFFDMAGPAVMMIADQLARQEDLRIHREILWANDEYKPLQIINETTQDVPAGGGTAGEWMYSGGGGITFQGKTYGSNVHGAIWLRRGNASGGAVELGPVVPTRPVLEDRGMTNGSMTGIVEYYKNPLKFSGAGAWGTVGGVAQVLGYLDDTNSIRAYWPGETPTFAVDAENGVVVFVAQATSGFPTLAGPVPNTVLAEYAAARNFTRISQVIPPGFTRDTYMNTFIAAIRDLSSQLREGRLTYPDFCFGRETIMSNISDATAFQPNTRKEWAMLNFGFGPQITLGEVTGVGLFKSETPFVQRNRIRLGTRGTTIYMPTDPLKLIGPKDEYKISGTVGTPSGVDYYMMEQYSLLATMVKAKQDPTDVFEFPYTSLLVEGTNPATALGIV